MAYDPLTKVLNKCFLGERLDEQTSMAKRHKYPLSVMMVDIDDFKKYNDMYGHLQGDEALKHVAKTLNDATRLEDIIGRYGGEEFLIILP